MRKTSDVALTAALNIGLHTSHTHAQKARVHRGWGEEEELHWGFCTHTLQLPASPWVADR